MEYLSRLEVLQNANSECDSNELSSYIKQLIASNQWPAKILVENLMKYDFINSHVDKIYIADLTENYEILPLVDLDVLVYQLNEVGFAREDLDSEDCTAASNEWILPSSDFEGLWESLCYEEHIKHQLLSYSYTIMQMASHNINNNIINFNRLILLNGPPGTGKTSLCKSLAHKLSILLSPMFKCAYLIEINSHSLFSKWFSESGKLVVKMFSKILSIVSIPNSLVCILIDEVESLSMSRQSLSANEPSDSIRVVNAVLTQLDIVKSYPNVLILTTSNLTSNIDDAFLDRADLKLYIGPPGESAIYEIYYSCIMELIRVGLVVNNDILLAKIGPITNDLSTLLLSISRLSVGLTGRTLRKLPVIALSLNIKKKKLAYSIQEFLNALKLAVETHRQNDLKSINHKFN